MQNKLNDRFPSCLIRCCYTTLSPRPLNQEPLRFVFVSTQTCSYDAEIIQLQFNPLWMMNTTISQETSILYHILEPINLKTFSKIILVRSLRSSFIDSFSFAKKRCNTLQGFGAFSFSHVIDYCFVFFSRFFFLFFLDFNGNQCLSFESTVY